MYHGQAQPALFFGVLHPPSSPHDNPALFTTLSLFVLRCNASIKALPQSSSFFLRVITWTRHDRSSPTTTSTATATRTGINLTKKRRKTKNGALLLLRLLECCRNWIFGGFDMLTCHGHHAKPTRGVRSYGDTCPSPNSSNVCMQHELES